MALLIVLTLLLVVTAVCSTKAEPNPPKWPSTVHIISPTDVVSDIEALLADAFANNGGHTPSNHGQFSTKRYAFLFKPGNYDVNAPVGYYTQVMGMGTQPDEVLFTSELGVYSPEGDYTIGGALSSFWRSAENFKTMANHKWYVGTGMMWAVSQAAPLRRVEIENDLLLFQYEPPIPSAGEASGGYMSNIKVNNGTVKPGSQQQWYARDSTVAGWSGGAWNMVFTGVEGAPPSHCDNSGATPSTNILTTPVISEKPFITYDHSSEKFSLHVPSLKINSKGNDFDTSNDKSIDFSNVYVTQLNDTATQINKKLSIGLNVIFSPGIYYITTPLIINHPNTIILGLGLATLVASNQTKTIFSVGDVDGVRICGVLLQAGSPKDITNPQTNNMPVNGTTLIQWGTGNGYSGSSTNPGFLQDVFFRVGGPDGTLDAPVNVETMLHIHNGNVIGDNMWLWRADHAATGTVSYSGNQNYHGLVVDGDDVSM
jgi:hypothetical protein